MPNTAAAIATIKRKLNNAKANRAYAEKQYFNPRCGLNARAKWLDRMDALEDTIIQLEAMLAEERAHREELTY